MKPADTRNIEKILIMLTQELLMDQGEKNSDHPITLDCSLQHQLGIDSLGKAELFTRIEKKFSLQLSQHLFIEADTLKAILLAIITSTPRQSRLSVNK